MLRMLTMSAVCLACMTFVQPPRKPAPPGEGVPLSLARDRARRISHLRYELHFTIPPQAAAPLRGRVTLRFTLRDASQPLVLDFSPPGGNGARAAGEEIQLSAVPDHLIVRPED